MKRLSNSINIERNNNYNKKYALKGGKKWESGWWMYNYFDDTMQHTMGVTFMNCLLSWHGGYDQVNVIWHSWIAYFHDMVDMTKWMSFDIHEMLTFSHMNVESKYEAITTSITKPTSTLIAIPNSSWDFYGYCGQTNHGNG